MAKKKTKTALVLPADVAAKYKCVSIRPGKHNFHGYGTIDLRTISLKKADELFGKKFPFLVELPANKSKDPKGSDVK